MLKLQTYWLKLNSSHFLGSFFDLCFNLPHFPFLSFNRSFEWAKWERKKKKIQLTARKMAAIFNVTRKGFEITLIVNSRCFMVKGFRTNIKQKICNKCNDKSCLRSTINESDARKRERKNWGKLNHILLLDFVSWNWKIFLYFKP